MGTKKYSDLRYAWKKSMSTEEFMSSIGPFVASGCGGNAFSDAFQEYVDLGGRNALTMDYLILSGSPAVSHYFLETKELFDFLVESPIKEPGFAHLMAHEWPVRLNVGKELLYGPSRVLVLHHQYPALPSIKVIYQLLHEGTPDESFYVYTEDGDEFAGFSEKSFLDGKRQVPSGYYISNLNDEATWGKPGYRYARLALNFLLYERCFPGSIVPGVPEGIANQNHYKKYGLKHIMSPHPSVLRKDSYGSKSPHFRSGYFKTLSSEYYTHKRGQVIFVDATFVKGKAETVEDNKEKQL